HGTASPRTAARRLSAMRGFYRFLAREGIRVDDPTTLLEGPRPRPSLPKYLSEAEVDALLATAASRPNPLAHAALEILYTTGLLPVRVRPHLLWHGFASHRLARGSDLRILQFLLGHADVATTQIYTHVLAERLQELVRLHHPLSQQAARG